MKAAKTTMPATRSGNAIVVYEPDETMRLNVRLENETVWLTQEQMCQLFGRTQSVIARHIGNIFKEGELDRKVVYAKFAYTTRHGAIEGKTQTKEVGLVANALRSRSWTQAKSQTSGRGYDSPEPEIVAHLFKLYAEKTARISSYAKRN